MCIGARAPGLAPMCGLTDFNLRTNCCCSLFSCLLLLRFPPASCSPYSPLSLSSLEIRVVTPRNVIKFIKIRCLIWPEIEISRFLVLGIFQSLKYDGNSTIAIELVAVVQ